MAMSDIILTVTTSLFFLVIALFVCNKDRLNFINISVIWIYHNLFSFLYYSYSLTNQADTSRYFNSSLKEYNSGNIVEFSLGSEMIHKIHYLLFYLDFNSIIPIYVFFGGFGFLGIVLIYKLLPKVESTIQNLLMISFIFLPSLHYWSSSPGKDSLSLFCIILWAYFLLTDKVNLSLIASGLLFMIRPHIAIIQIILYMYLKKEHIFNGKPYRLILLALPIIYILLEIVLSYTKFDINMT